MPKHYAQMPDECRIVVEEMVRKFHPEVEKAGVKIDLLSVAHDNEDAAALTLHGYPCTAVIRVVSIKERTKGAGDVEITFDEERWTEMEPAQQRALVDHELYHIELKIDPKTMKVKMDTCGRPKIGLRKHDVQVGWFAAIAERHKEASAEVMQAHGSFLSYRQTFFGFVPEAKALNP